MSSWIVPIVFVAWFAVIARIGYIFASEVVEGKKPMRWKLALLGMAAWMVVTMHYMAVFR